MRWGNLLWKMRMEQAPKAFRATLDERLMWGEEMSAWTRDWLSRTWGARSITSAILGAR